MKQNATINIKIKEMRKILVFELSDDCDELINVAFQLTETPTPLWRSTFMDILYFRNKSKFVVNLKNDVIIWERITVSIVRESIRAELDKIITMTNKEYEQKVIENEKIHREMIIENEKRMNEQKVIEIERRSTKMLDEMIKHI